MSPNQLRIPSALDVQCLLILQAAASSDLGIVVVTSNPIKARAALYNARKEVNDSSLASLQIRVSPNDSEREIWLIKRNITQGFHISEDIV